MASDWPDKSAGNGAAERFIRTLREQLLWLHRFRTVAELLEALHAFKARYNTGWLVEKHRHRSPAQARAFLIGEAAA